MSRVLIVGGGLTGTVCACLLHRQLLNKVQLTVWDQCSGAGGRMCTSPGPTSWSCSADLGAQYITATSHYAKIHKRFYEELLLHAVLRPLEVTVDGMISKEDGSVNYVAPSGMSSIVKHFLKESGADVHFGRHVTHVYRKGPGWLVCQEGVWAEQFDVLVLTMPVPQILQLQGDISSTMRAGDRQVLEAVCYSCRFALGLFYNTAVCISVPWAAKYVSNNPCIRYIAIDDKKRNIVSERGPSVVVHTTVSFGLQHVDHTAEVVQDLILQEVQNVIPELPAPDSIRCKRWRYSQVTSSAPGRPGQLSLSSSPLLLCGGDGFTHSDFDGCVESALKIFEVLKSSL